MRKIVMVIFFLIFITGCGNTNTKTLTCKTTTESDGMKINLTVVGTWQEENLKKITLDANYQLKSNLDKEQKKTFQTYVDTTMNTWKNKKGVNYTSNIENNQFSMFLEIDAFEGKEALKEFGIIVEKANYDSLKDVLEKENYQCEE